MAASTMSAGRPLALIGRMDARARVPPAWCYELDKMQCDMHYAGPRVCVWTGSSCAGHRVSDGSSNSIDCTAGTCTNVTETAHHVTGIVAGTCVNVTFVLCCLDCTASPAHRVVLEEP